MSSTKVGNCTRCRTMVHEPVSTTEAIAKELIEKGECQKPRVDQLIAFCHACREFRIFSIWRTTYESAI